MIGRDQRQVSQSVRIVKYETRIREELCAIVFVAEFVISAKAVVGFAIEFRHVLIAR